MQGLAPDQASLTAAGGLLKPAKWPVLATARARSVVWGECQGSGSTPYRVCASLDDLGVSCTCPSRKQPCKHGLALLWFVADRPAALGDGTVPDWVEDWLGRRRKRGAPTPPPASAPKDIRAALAPPPADAADEAKKAAAAERRRQEREAAVLAGLEELDRWIGDVAGDGLATFAPRAVERCRRIASRLVDAKAGALATRIDALPGALFALPDGEREAWLAGELGRLVLLTRAYRRQDALPPALREDLRRLIGWSVTREAMLADPATTRVDATWTVLAVRGIAQPDGLLRRETWLRRHGPGEPDFAVLLDYMPIAAAGDPTFAAGEVLRATLAFYASAAPLRAQIDVRDADLSDAPPERGLDGDAGGLDAAFAAAQLRVARQPWLEPIPVLVADAHLGRVASRFVLTTPDGAMQRVLNDADAALYALAAAGPARVALLIEAGGVRILAASTALGFWSAS